MTRAEVVERARAAVGRLDRDVLLSGPSRRNGLDGEVALALSPRDAFVDQPPSS